MTLNALICEDNLTTAYVIKEMLGKLEYTSDIVQTASDALLMLEKNKYDLMTLDILLPDTNGIQLLKTLNDNESAKNMPVIVISALEKETFNLNFEHNIISWIKKSFDMKEFDEAVKNISTNKSAQKIEILHVENDQDLMSLIEITLSDIANVTQSNNLIDAKKILEERKFDIIILDYVFPEGTSDKLILTIKQGVNKDAKIVMFSAYEENRILKNYVDEIIIKTNISFDEFKNCIERYIKQE